MSAKVTSPALRIISLRSYGVVISAIKEKEEGQSQRHDENPVTDKTEKGYFFFYVCVMSFFRKEETMRTCQFVPEAMFSTINL